MRGKMPPYPAAVKPRGRLDRPRPTGQLALMTMNADDWLLITDNCSLIPSSRRRLLLFNFEKPQA
jgi:hypothetical protein